MVNSNEQGTTLNKEDKRSQRSNEDSEQKEKVGRTKNGAKDCG